MIHLQVLGSLGITADGGHTVQSVLAQPKRAALLAYLAAAQPRGFKSRDILLALFWPESDEDSARHSLRQAVYNLRRALGEDVILSRGNEIGINPARLACDIESFMATFEKGEWAEALALYRGDLLEGFHISDAPEFEMWMAIERDRLRAHATQAAWELIEKAESRGDLPEALKWARQAQALAPMEEAVLRRLLSLLGKAGERGEAVRAYEAFAEWLRSEFDLEPSAETQALIAKLRSPDAFSLPPSGPSEHRAPGQDLGAEKAQEELVPAARDAPVAPGRPSSPHPGRTPRYRMRWIGAGATAMILLAVTLSLSPRAQRSVLKENRVLVASLENRTGDASLDLLGDMAADWITQGLQQTGMVEVIDPVSALLSSREVADDSTQSKGLARIAALAEKSGAGVVISGAVYRQGDSLHFQASVTDVRKNRLLFTLDPVSSRVDDAVGGVERLRSRVAGALASMLDERIASISASSSRPPNLEAYQEYIAGLEQFQRSRSREALQHFEAAARLDSTFSLPLVWAAFAYGGDRAARDSVVQILADRRDRLRPLERHALEYFEADAREDLVNKLAAARAAAQLAPGSEWGHNAAQIALAQNRPREALRYLQQIDPEHGWAKGWASYWLGLTGVYHYLGGHEAELEAAGRALKLDPQNSAHHLYRIRALIASGRLEEAEEGMETVLLLPTSQFPAGGLMTEFALELHGHGHTSRAREWLNRAADWGRSPAAEAWIRTHADHVSAREIVREGLAIALYHAGRSEEARTILEVPLRERSAVDTRYLGLIAAQQGNRAEAERAILALEERKSIPRAAAIASFQQAQIVAILGDRERAVQYLREWASKNGSPTIVVNLHIIPGFENLKDYPPFQRLMRPKG